MSRSPESEPSLILYLHSREVISVNNMCMALGDSFHGYENKYLNLRRDGKDCYHWVRTQH